MRGLGFVLLLACLGCGGGSGAFDASDASPRFRLDVVSIPVDVSVVDAPYVDPAVCGQGWPEYKVMIALDPVDAGACASRPTVPCESDGGVAFQLTGQMRALVQGVCRGPLHASFYRVVFSEGCATHLCLWGAADSAAIRACLPTALSASRFACAEAVPYWEDGESTLP
jgi:hypothetical protein